MTLLSRLPFRFTILILIALLAAVFILFNHFVLKAEVEGKIDEQSQKFMLSSVNRLQGSAEYLLSKNDLEGLRREISANSVYPDIKQLIILDENLITLASSQIADQGKSLDELILHINRETIKKVLTTKGSYIEKDIDGENSIYGVAPISIVGNDRIRDQRWGLLILEVDLDIRQKALLMQMERLFWVSAILVCFIGGVFWLIYYKAIDKRIRIIISSSKKIANGAFDTRINLSGKDELATIAKAIDMMASEIEEDHQELLSSHKQIDSIIQNMPAMLYIKDKQGRYLLANEKFKRTFPAIKVGSDQTVYDVLPRSEADSFSQWDAIVLETAEASSKQAAFTYANEQRDYSVVKFPLFDRNQEAYAVCSIATDISEQEHTDNLLNISTSIFENTAEGIMITDMSKRILDVNQSFQRITEYAKSEVIGRNPRFLSAGETPHYIYREMWQSIDEKGHWQGELINRRKGGEVYHERLSINSIKDRNGKLTGYIGFIQDISKEKSANEHLSQLAFTDPLTKLHNRESFKLRLQESIDFSRRYSYDLGVLFIDLDYFKEVNDTYGHEAGDQLLSMVADRLLSNCRNTDIVSRLGGDEFIILVRNVENESGLAAQANQIIKKLQKPFQLEGATVLIGATIGIAVFPKDADTSDQLLKHADAAMYHAKSLGRGCFSFFDFSINARNQRIIRLKQAMRTAIEQNEYRLVYQPQIDPHVREITGYEALIRWESDELGYVSPAEFIPVAEDSGEIDRITHWVIQQVADDRKQSSVLGEHTVSINISAKQFQNDSWVNTLRTMSEEHRLDLSSIVVEVTETALVAEFDSTLEQLKAIRRLGVRVAIDDFGTGYSSLAYLKKMPINYLKIDRTFVSDIGIDSDDQTIVQTVIAMAHALDITVIAEGAESIEQVAFLTANGCDKIQGYYYSKPLELAEVDHFVLL